MILPVFEIYNKAHNWHDRVHQCNPEHILVETAFYHELAIMLEKFDDADDGCCADELRETELHRLRDIGLAERVVLLKHGEMLRQFIQRQVRQVNCDSNQDA